MRRAVPSTEDGCYGEGMGRSRKRWSWALLTVTRRSLLDILALFGRHGMSSEMRAEQGQMWVTYTKGPHPLPG